MNKKTTTIIITSAIVLVAIGCMMIGPAALILNSDNGKKTSQ